MNLKLKKYESNLKLYESFIVSLFASTGLAVAFIILYLIESKITFMGFLVPILSIFMISLEKDNKDNYLKKSNEGNEKNKIKIKKEFKQKVNLIENIRNKLSLISMNKYVFAIPLCFFIILMITTSIEVHKILLNIMPCPILIVFIIMILNMLSLFCAFCVKGHILELREEINKQKEEIGNFKNFKNEIMFYKNEKVKMVKTYRNAFLLLQKGYTYNKEDVIEELIE